MRTSCTSCTHCQFYQGRRYKQNRQLGSRNKKVTWLGGFHSFKDTGFEFSSNKAQVPDRKPVYLTHGHTLLVKLKSQPENWFIWHTDTLCIYCIHYTCKAQAPARKLVYLTHGHTLHILYIILVKLKYKPENRFIWHTDTLFIYCTLYL